MTDQEILITVKGESDKLRKELALTNKELKKLQKTSDKGLKGLNKSVDQTSRSFKNLATHLGKIASIYAAFEGLKSVITTTADFEQTIKSLGVVSGATSSQLLQLSEEAKKLGATTKFSATEVATGMKQMAMAGMDSAGILTGMEDVLNLSAVGMLEVADAAEIAMGVMHGFGLEADDLGDITDALAKGSTNSATTVEQLGRAIAKTAPVAKSLNISLEETVAALGALADANIKAELSGTQLKIVMQRMYSNPEAVKWLDSIGAKMYDVAGKTKPFSKALLDIKEKLADLNEEERNTATAKIFGTESAAAAQILMNNLDSISVKLLGINKAMKENFAATAAKDMMDTLTGDFQNFQASVESVALSLGEGLIPELRDTLQLTTEMLRSMNTEEIANFGRAIGELIKILVQMLGGVTSVVGALIKMGSGVPVLTDTFTTLAGSLFLAYKALKGMTSLLFSAVGALKAAKDGTGLLGASFVALSNPIGIALMALAALTAEYYAYHASLLATNKANAKASNYTASLIEATNDLAESYLQVAESAEKAGGASEKTVQSILDSMIKTYLATQKYIKQLEQKKRLTDQERVAIEQLKTNLESLRVYMTKIGQVKLFDKATEDANKFTKAVRETGKVSDEVAKSLGKMGKAYVKATDKAMKSLDALAKKETALITQAEKLGKARKDIFTKYADERIDVERKYNDLIFDESIKKLGAYQQAKYKSEYTLRQIAQISADAQKALDEGRYDRAKTLNDEYLAMIQGLTQEEWKNARQTGKLTDYKLDALNRAKTVALAVIEEEEQAKLKANKLNLEMANAQLLATRAQITAIRIYTKTLQGLYDTAKKNKITFGDDAFKKLDADLAKAQDNLNLLLTQNEVAMDTSKARAELAKLGLSAKEIDERMAFKASIEVDKKALNNLKSDVRETSQTLTATPIDIPIHIPVQEAKDKIYEITDEDYDKVILQVNADIADNELKKDVQTVTEDVENSEEVKVDIKGNGEPLKEDARDTAAYISQNIKPEVEYLPDTSTVDSASLKLASNVVHIPVVYDVLNSPGVAAAKGGLIPKFSTGGTFTGSGRVPGYDSTDSDKVNAKLTGGEVVIKRQATDFYGADFLLKLNSMKIPKLPGYASGGYVDSAKTSTAATPNLQPINLNIGDSSFSVMSDQEVGEALKRHLNKTGGR